MNQSDITFNPVAKLILETRNAHGMNMRDFGDALEVSHAAIGKFETGEIQPGGSTLARWLHDEREWVSNLAEEIFVARYRETIQIVYRQSAPVAA